MLTVTFRYPDDPYGVKRTFAAMTNSAAAAERIARACIAGEIEILSVSGVSGPAFSNNHARACAAYDAAAGL